MTPAASQQQRGVRESVWWQQPYGGDESGSQRWMIKHNTAQRCSSRLWFTRTELLLIVLGSRAVTLGEGHCRGGKPRQPHGPRLPDTCPLCLFKHLLMAPHSAPIEPFLLLSRCHKESNEKTEHSREWWRPIRCTYAINTGSLHYTLHDPACKHWGSFIWRENKGLTKDQCSLISIV